MALIDNDQILLPNLIDELARLDPERLYCALVKSRNVDDGFRKVTYGEFANAVNRCAWWLEEQVGKSDHFTTLAYVGMMDIRYTIMTLAATKVGYKAMLISPANSIAAQLKLLEASQCNTLLVATDFIPFKPAAAAISAKRNMQNILVERLDYWLASEKVPEYPLHATLDDDPYRPFVVLHTSASTGDFSSLNYYHKLIEQKGMPEPITWTFTAVAAYRRLLFKEKMVPDVPKTMVDVWKNNCLYMAFPPFHAVGSITLTTLCVYWNMPIILGPPNMLPSPELASRIISLDICTAAVISPAVLQEMAKNPEQLEGLQKLAYLSWCGAPFSSAAVADKIKAKVNLYAAYGATECGILPLAVENEEHPEWMNFHPMIGATFRHNSEDLYELVIVRDPKIQSIQVIFHIFPELSEWPSKDMFSKHPTKDLWRYRGRRDDIIIMANGLKINPIPMEGTVMSHPQVICALLVGTDHIKTAWLIEPKEPPTSVTDKNKLIEDIWPFIEKASQDAPAQGHISKDAILFTTKEKPMLRAAKGSVQRKLTIRAYREELDAILGASD